MELSQFHYYTATFTYSLYLFLTERKRKKNDKSTTGIWIYIYLTILVTFALLDCSLKECSFEMWFCWCEVSPRFSVAPRLRQTKNASTETSCVKLARLLYAFHLICIIHYINDPIKMLKLMTVSVLSRVGVRRRLCFYKSLSFLLIDTI